MSENVLWGLYALILLAANILGAVGGFGAGLISIPFLTQLFDTKNVVMASTMTCVLNVFISIKNRDSIDWKELLKICSFMCIGLLPGVYALKVVDSGALKLFLGCFMVLLGIYGFLKLRCKKIREFKFSKALLLVFLIAGGIVQGAVSSGGAFVLLYAQQNIEEKKQFRATLALLWTLVSLVAVIQYLLMGTLTAQSVKMFAVGTPAVLAGIFLGGVLCGKLSQRAFMYLINSIITIAGLLNCVTVLVRV